MLPSNSSYRYTLFSLKTPCLPLNELHILPQCHGQGHHQTLHTETYIVCTKVNSSYTLIGKSFWSHKNRSALAKINQIWFQQKKELNYWNYTQPIDVNVFSIMSSNKNYTASGVPQESNLSPHLLLLFINDLALNYCYHIDTELTRAETIRVSGVTFDARLSISTQIKNIVVDASRAFDLIIRNCRDFSNIENSLLKLCQIEVWL